MAEYPGTIPTIAADKANATVMSTDHPGHHNKLAEEVVAIATELGVTPSGGFATVAARLAADMINVKNHGAVGDGVANDTAAFVAAQAAGTHLFLPQGTYLVDDDTIILTTTGSVLYGPAATIKARTGTGTLVKIATSECQVDLHKLDANSQAAIKGLSLAPADEASTTVLAFQNYNSVTIRSIAGFTDGLVVRCGPKVAGADSGCWYNEICVRSFDGNLRAIWLRDSTSSPTASASPNRNRFYVGRVGGGGCNLGIDIQAGDTNKFYGAGFEQIITGTSPAAIPTAIRIAAAAGTGAANNDNMFFGSDFEACDRDLENDNAYTQFYGHTIRSNKRTGSQIPAVMMGSDPAQQPVILPKFRYPEGSLAGADSTPTFLKKLQVNESSTKTEMGPVGPTGQAGILLDGDTGWYRHAADTVRSGDVVVADGSVYANFATVNQTLLASAGIRFGLSADAGLQRSATGTGSIATTGGLELPAVASGTVPNGGMFRNVADDRLTYKDGGGTLQALEGRGLRAPVRVAAPVNVTISAPGATIDGVTMVAGDRVLLANQTTASQNGIYTWAAAATTMTRATDSDTAAKLTDSLLVTVDEGTVNRDSIFSLSTNKPITLGTTSLRFSRIHPAPTVSSHPPGSAYQPTNSKLENIPRDTVDLSNQAALATGTIRVFPMGIQRAGDTLANINFYVGTTASASITNSWAGIARLSDRVILAISATSTVTTAANTKKTFPFASAFTADKDEVLVGFVMYQATTVPSLFGINHGNAVIISEPPIVNGTANTGQTTPLTVGTALGAFTADTEMISAFCE